MNPISLEIKLIAGSVLVLAAVLAVFAWNLHEQHKGEAKCEKADTTALERQVADFKKKAEDYQLQLKDANAKLSDAQGRLNALAAKPAPHLVCHSADSVPVSRVPAETDGGLAAPGPFDSVRQRDFDPGPALQGLSIAYERRVEQARDALNRWP